MSVNGPPIGFAPSAPNAPLPPPSYDEAMSQQGPGCQHPQPQATVSVKAMPYPAVPQYVVQQPVMQQQQQQPIVIAQTSRAVLPVIVNVGPNPARIQCPHCRQEVTTRVETEIQKMAHIAALILCCIGCFFLSCIPYCLASFKDVVHTCPKCKSFIGVYKH